MVPAKPFPKGNQLRKGIPNPNAGRKKDWYKSQCDRLLYDGALFKLLARIASGQETRKHIIDGKIAETGPDFGNMIKAIQELRDTAHGRPSQHVDVTNDKALMELLSAVSLLLKQKVPRTCKKCRADLGILEVLAREFEEISTRFQSKDAGVPPLQEERG